MADPETLVVFVGGARIAVGPLGEAALAAKRAGAGVLVFGPAGQVRDLDLRGSEAEVMARYSPPPSVAAKRGRPRLGVTAREVTLLPRHWDWLAAQPGGASVALRKLVEAASKANDPAATARARREAAYSFMSAMAGDRPGFEEASRALFAGDRERLESLSQAWPPDVRDQVLSYLDAG